MLCLDFSEEIKEILILYSAVVYIVPFQICSTSISTATNSNSTHPQNNVNKQDLIPSASPDNFCGSEDERVPASVFRYFFYEKWASRYNETTWILTADFKDVIFQGNPFLFRKREWKDYQ